MQVTVNFRHMDSSEPLRDYAVKKLEKLGIYLHEPVRVEVWISVGKKGQQAEAEVRSKGYDEKFSVEGKPDAYALVDMLEEKVEKALRRHKEKIKDHKNNKAD